MAEKLGGWVSLRSHQELAIGGAGDSPSLLLVRLWRLGASRGETCQRVGVSKDRTIEGLNTEDQSSLGQLWRCVHVCSFVNEGVYIYIYSH